MFEPRCPISNHVLRQETLTPDNARSIWWCFACCCYFTWADLLDLGLVQPQRGAV
jgi:hypothetical protein